MHRYNQYVFQQVVDPAHFRPPHRPATTRWGTEIEHSIHTPEQIDAEAANVATRMDSRPNYTPAEWLEQPIEELEPWWRETGASGNFSFPRTCNWLHRRGAYTVGQLLQLDPALFRCSPATLATLRRVLFEVGFRRHRAEVSR